MIKQIAVLFFLLFCTIPALANYLSQDETRQVRQHAQYERTLATARWADKFVDHAVAQHEEQLAFFARGTPVIPNCPYYDVLVPDGCPNAPNAGAYTVQHTNLFTGYAQNNIAISAWCGQGTEVACSPVGGAGINVPGSGGSRGTGPWQTNPYGCGAAASPPPCTKPGGFFSANHPPSWDVPGQYPVGIDNAVFSTNLILNGTDGTGDCNGQTGCGSAQAISIPNLFDPTAGCQWTAHTAASSGGCNFSGSTFIVNTMALFVGPDGVAGKFTAGQPLCAFNNTFNQQGTCAVICNATLCPSTPNPVASAVATTGTSPVLIYSGANWGATKSGVIQYSGNIANPCSTPWQLSATSNGAGAGSLNSVSLTGGQVGTCPLPVKGDLGWNVISGTLSNGSQPFIGLPQQIITGGVYTVAGTYTLTYAGAGCATPPAITATVSANNGPVTAVTAVTAGSCQVAITDAIANWTVTAGPGSQTVAASIFINFKITYNIAHGSGPSGSIYIVYGLPNNCTYVWSNAQTFNSATASNYVSCGNEMMQGYDFGSHGGVALSNAGTNCIDDYDNFVIGSNGSFRSGANYYLSLACQNETLNYDIVDSGGFQPNLTQLQYAMQLLGAANGSFTAHYTAFLHNPVRMLQIGSCGITIDMRYSLIEGDNYWAPQHGDLMMENTNCSPNYEIASFTYSFMTEILGGQAGGYGATCGWVCSEGGNAAYGAADIENNVIIANMGAGSFTASSSASSPCGAEAAPCLNITNVGLTYSGNGGGNMPTQNAVAFTPGVSGGAFEGNAAGLALGYPTGGNGLYVMGCSGCTPAIAAASISSYYAAPNLGVAMTAMNGASVDGTFYGIAFCTNGSSSSPVVACSGSNNLYLLVIEMLTGQVTAGDTINGITGSTTPTINAFVTNYQNNLGGPASVALQSSVLGTLSSRTFYTFGATASYIFQMQSHWDSWTQKNNFLDPTAAFGCFSQLSSATFTQSTSINGNINLLDGSSWNPSVTSAPGTVTAGLLTGNIETLTFTPALSASFPYPTKVTASGIVSSGGSDATDWNGTFNTASLTATFPVTGISGTASPYSVTVSGGLSVQPSGTVVTLSGNTPSNFNGNYTITSGSLGGFTATSPVIDNYTVTNIAPSGPNFTVTATSIPALTAGVTLTLSGNNPSTLDGTYTVISGSVGSFVASSSTSGSFVSGGTASPNWASGGTASITKGNSTTQISFTNAAADGTWSSGGSFPVFTLSAPACNGSGVL